MGSLCARVYDSDGELLLIEAADQVPRCGKCFLEFSWGWGGGENFGPPWFLLCEMRSDACFVSVTIWLLNGISGSLKYYPRKD